MAGDFLSRCRSSLESVDCPWIVQLPDFELESWLFQPGPLHTKALMWALVKINPELSEHFHLIKEKDIEKEIVRLFASNGLVKSTEADKVMGRAPRSVLELFWDSVLHHLCLLQDCEAKDNLANPDSEDALSFLATVASNSDFWDILEKKPSLLPPHIMLPPLKVTLEDLKNQLAEAEEDLNNVCNESRNALEESTVDSHSAASRKEGERIPKNMDELVALQKSNIDGCYERFLQQMVGVIKKSPPNPVAEQLAQIVVNLHGELLQFAQFLNNVDETKRSATKFSSQALPEDVIATRNSLHDFIASMVQQISVISGIISANQDLLEV